MANQLTASEQAALEAFADALATERIDDSTAVRYLRVLFEPAPALNSPAHSRDSPN